MPILDNKPDIEANANINVKSGTFIITGIIIIALLAITALFFNGYQPALLDFIQKIFNTDKDNKISPNTKEKELVMISSWDKRLDILDSSLNSFAQNISTLTNGKLHIKIISPGENINNKTLVPSDVFELVKHGDADMGHSASYYWKKNIPEAQFFTTVPFGLEADGMYSWLNYKDGFALNQWRNIYKQHDLYPIPMGSTGIQMGGWFNKPISQPSDLSGMRIRMPGMGGEILKRMGAVVSDDPPSELATKISNGSLDGAEWIGPHDDKRLGLDNIKNIYYYYPGWHEPSTTFELIINMGIWSKLDDSEKKAIEISAKAAHLDIYSNYQLKNAISLKSIKDKGINISKFGDDTLNILSKETIKYLEETSRQNNVFSDIYNDYREFSELYMPLKRFTSHVYRDGETNSSSIEKATTSISNKTDENSKIVTKNDCQFDFDPGLLYFQNGKDELIRESHDKILEYIKSMQNYSQFEFEIYGYTDDIGNDEKNKELSEKRALAVKNIFTANGYSNEAIKTIGAGETNKFSTINKDENRRVEIRAFRCK